jgi:hypothetical protein
MPSERRDILNQWYESMLENPYPTEEQKEKLTMKTVLTV